MIFSFALKQFVFIKLASVFVSTVSFYCTFLFIIVCIKLFKIVPKYACFLAPILGFLGWLNDGLSLSFFPVLLCYLFITYTFHFSANKNTYESRILAELALGHLRYSLTDMPPQPNSPPDTISSERLTRPTLGEKLSGTKDLVDHGQLRSSKTK